MLKLQTMTLIALAVAAVKGAILAKEATWAELVAVSSLEGGMRFMAGLHQLQLGMPSFHGYSCQ